MTRRLFCLLVTAITGYLFLPLVHSLVCWLGGCTNSPNALRLNTRLSLNHIASERGYGCRYGYMGIGLGVGVGVGAGVGAGAGICIFCVTGRLRPITFFDDNNNGGWE